MENSETEPVNEMQQPADMDDSAEPLQQEASDWKEKYLRIVAELDNMQKRIETRYATQLQQEKQRILSDMLTVADNLERALQHAKPSDGKNNGLQAGVELTLKAFLDTLMKYGVKPIDAEGKPFDVKLHEAVGTIHGASQPPGTVVSVEQRGYKYGEELLRPARVFVAAE
jgi:molecular chaperone GrpE